MPKDTSTNLKVVVIGKRPLSYNKKKYRPGDVFECLHIAHARALRFTRQVADYNEKEVALDNFERNEIKDQFREFEEDHEKEQKVITPASRSPGRGRGRSVRRDLPSEG